MTELEEAQAIGRAAAHEWNTAHAVGTPVLAWPGLRTDEPLRTRTRSSAWTLGAGDAVVMVVGQAGGIALTHIEHDPTRQPAVPDISFEAPPCPICGKGLESDGDGFDCRPCGASWSTSGENGTWDDPNAERCPAVGRRYSTIAPHEIERCCLAADHIGDTHRSEDGWSDWTDSDQQRALVDSYGEQIGDITEVVR